MRQSFMETQTCRISTRLPVHVGCGGYQRFGELQWPEALKSWDRTELFT